MSFVLTPIDRVDHISKEDFTKNYLEPRRPLVISKLSESWPALEKWTFEYLKQVVGDKTVPLYDSSKADPSKPINAATTEMKFADYIELIKKEPTDLRIFFFDPIKHANGLMNDFSAPKHLMGGFLDKYPGMFFGGTSSETFLHYDIDLPHIWHTHFLGRKHIILFDYKWRDRLYCLPFATYALEDFKVEKPDFEKFPSLNGIHGYEIIMNHGDTLFMPTGMWHWMKYLDGSFSISLRAWDKSPLVKAKSLFNLTIQRKFDDFMKQNFNVKYMNWKEQKAVQRAEKALAQGLPK